jgi:hypothetical protein
MELLGRCRQLVHGDVHCRETKHRADADRDEKPLPGLHERYRTRDASVGDVSDEVIQEGRDRVVTDLAAPFIL